MKIIWPEWHKNIKSRYANCRDSVKSIRSSKDGNKVYVHFHDGRPKEILKLSSDWSKVELEVKGHS